MEVNPEDSIIKRKRWKKACVLSTRRHQLVVYNTRLRITAFNAAALSVITIMQSTMPKDVSPVVLRRRPSSNAMLLRGVCIAAI